MNLIILGYIMEGVMRNYQVGILTGLLYVLFLIVLGMTEIQPYESYKILKPVVIFEPLSNLEGKEFDENEFVSDYICHAETLKALDRQNIKTHAITTVSTKSTILKKTNNETSKYTKEEINLLESVAYLEAGNQGLLGMRLVVDVILNRVESAKFPNNIHDVIFQPGQFSTARKIDENANTLISENVRKAVSLEISGKRVDVDSLYFARKPITQKGLYQVGDHYFSR